MKVSKSKLGFIKKNRKFKPKLTKPTKRKNEKQKDIFRSKTKTTSKGKSNKSYERKELKRKQVNQIQEEEEEEDYGDDMLEMMESEDVDFLETSIRNKSYSFLKNVKYVPKDNANKKVKDRDEDIDDKENDINDYENEYKKNILQIKKEEEKKSKLEKELLPIKSGKEVVRRIVKCKKEEKKEKRKPYFRKEEKEGSGDDDKEEDNETEKNDKEEEESDEELALFKKKNYGYLDVSNPVNQADLLACREKILQAKKFEIGVLCSSVLENPEGKINNLKKLVLFLSEKQPVGSITVKKYAMISLMEIFKDLIPSYQIKHINPEGVLLSKDTRARQEFETLLLRYYKQYLQKLEAMTSFYRTRGKRYLHTLSEPQKKISKLAVFCLGQLFIENPSFNFSDNLAHLMVSFLNCDDPSLRTETSKAVQTVFKEDRKGLISLQTVRFINKLVKARSHFVHAEVLKVLLSLRIKDVDLDKEKEEQIKEKKFLNYKEKLSKMSKMERKRSKLMEQVERDLLETKAEVSKQLKSKNFTETTKLVFTIYFRILKQAPKSKLLSVTLEGLAKFAHIINIEYYQDLINVLSVLIDLDTISYREQLHIVQTVFIILSDQGRAITIDPYLFYKHLYKNLIQINAGRSERDLPAVLKTLNTVLIERRKQVTQQRLLAFTKRLATMSLEQLHNGSLGCLSIIRTILQFNSNVDILLDTDSSVGDGIFFPHTEDPEYCNASSTALWELIKLQNHYHPTVRDWTNNILQGTPTMGAGSLLVDETKMSCEQIYEAFDPSEMSFNPPIPAPGKTELKSKKLTKFWNSLENEVKYVLNEDYNIDVNFLCDLDNKNK